LPDIVVSSITGNEFGRTREEMRSNALLHLSMFPIDGAKNKDTGWMLVMAKDDKKRLVYQSGNPYAFSAIYALESLVSRAILAESHEDFVNKNPDVQAIHNFFAPLEIGGRLYRVKLIVRDYKGEGSGEKTKLRAIAAVEIGSVLPGLHTLRETHAESAQPTTGRSVSIALLLKDARRNDGKPFVPGAALLKKSFDSFVVGAECVLRFPSGSVLVVEGGASCPWCSRIGHV
jgi:hypothetical protein